MHALCMPCAPVVSMFAQKCSGRNDQELVGGGATRRGGFTKRGGGVRRIFLILNQIHRTTVILPLKNF